MLAVCHSQAPSVSNVIMGVLISLAKATQLTSNLLSVYTIRIKSTFASNQLLHQINFGVVHNSHQVNCWCNMISNHCTGQPVSSHCCWGYLLNCTESVVVLSGERIQPLQCFYSRLRNAHCNQSIKCSIGMANSHMLYAIGIRVGISGFNTVIT